MAKAKRRAPAPKPGKAATAPPVVKPPRPRSPRVAFLLRVAPWLALVLALGVGAYVRLVPAWPSVFPAPGETRLFDTDSYYHLRHARHVAENYPVVKRWDDDLKPPRPALYAGLHDIGIATIAKLGATVEHATAILPPIVGVCTIGGLFWLGMIAGGGAVAALAIVLLTLVPGIFLTRSVLGYADHHCSEVLLGVLTIAGLTRCLQRGGRWWRPAVLHALPLSAFLFTWYGAPLIVVLEAATLFVASTLALARGDEDRVGPVALRYALGTIVVIAPLAAIAPWLIMQRETFFLTLVLLVLMGGGLFLYGWLARRLTARFSPRVVALLAVVLAGGLIAALSQITYGGRAFGEYLFEAKSPLVAEQGAITFKDYAYLGGAPAFLCLLALPLVAVQAWRGRDERHAFVPVLFGAMFLTLWLVSHDYGYAAPPFQAFGAALVLVWAFGQWPKVTAVLGLAAVAIPLAWTAPPSPSAQSLRTMMRINTGWVRSMEWLRDHTPEGAGPIREFWDFGHFVAAISRRPAVTSGSISPMMTRWYLLEDEETARKWPAPYTVADAETAADFVPTALRMTGSDVSTILAKRPDGLYEYGDTFKRSMISRMFDRDGSGLGHYRMIYASKQRSAVAYLLYRGRLSRRSFLLDATNEQMWRDRKQKKAPITSASGAVYEISITPSVKIFELVEGAKLVGRATPGATVYATLQLRADTAEYSLTYQHGAIADAAGGYEISVPYTTERDPTTDVDARGVYVVKEGDTTLGRARVKMTEVRLGAKVLVQ